MFTLNLRLDRDKKKALYEQIYDYFCQEIIAGHLKKDKKMPSIRNLSQILGVSKTTVENCYFQLETEGFIESLERVGYFVKEIADNPFDREESFLKKERKLDEVESYDFSSSHIDLESFDFALWRRCLNEALMDHKKRHLNYGSYKGEESLRKEIAKYIHSSRGVYCDYEQIIIGSGVQSLLNILCSVLKKDYQSLAFEEPGFNQARAVFSLNDFKIEPINLTEEGLDLGELEKSASDLVYLSPSHQFPTGITMPIGKRMEILNWAYENQALIIEDDYDSELRYKAKPIPSLQGLSKGEHVIYLGTFSKILLPSLRISYMVLPINILEKYGKFLEIYNQSSSKIEQIALEIFLRKGYLEKHIRRLRKNYGKKNRLLVESLEREMAGRVRIFGEESGLHLGLELDSKLSSETISSLAEAVGVKVRPMSDYYYRKKSLKKPLLILSYGGIPLEDIQPAVKLLKKTWFSQN